MKKRMFSIPYNCSNAEEYLNAIEPYKDNIDSIFFGFDTVFSNHHMLSINKVDLSVLLGYDFNLKEFLSHPKNTYKKIVTINSGHYPDSDIRKQYIFESIMIPLIDKYKIDAIIITDYNLAKYIHLNYPNIELQTSCNCFQWNIRQMKIWEEDCGIKLFNPPREISRTPKLLKEMHDCGFRIKMIVNENCLYGCPQTINHCMSLACDNNIITDCLRGNLDNMFKGNFVLPRWLRYYDEVVDVYKISGRGVTTDKIVKYLDSYINERDDIYFSDFINHGTIAFFRLMNIEIPTSIVPDKLLTCECRDCTNCKLCRGIMSKLLIENESPDKNWYLSNGKVIFK